MSLLDTFRSVRGYFSKPRHRYSTLPTGENEPRWEHSLLLGALNAAPHRQLFKFAVGVMVIFVVLVLFALQKLGMKTSCQSVGNCTDISQHVWGQYSPFFPVPSEIKTSLPKGCDLTFAAVLARHGARDPTAHKTDLYAAIIDRIQQSVSRYGVGYEFINDYTFDLGKDELTNFGRDEMRQAGEAFYQRYKALAGDTDPFFRAAGSDRVVESAQLFVEGFQKARGGSSSDLVDDILVIPEVEGFNNTLDHGGCPAFEEGPTSNLKSEKQEVWKKVWVDSIMRRVNRKLPGANLTRDETIYFMELCPFTTVANANGTSTRFCNLFSDAEWRNYDYFQSLDKWYGYGPGNPLGPTQGVGYVNELIARLTGQPVDDHTTTNSTLDSSPETFPLDRVLYADFSHDNTMTSIYGALGLYSETEDLPVKYKLSPHKARGYSAAWTVPFAGRMYVEKMQCGGSEELVRVLINDRVVPLEGCEADHLGRCKLGAFIDSLSFARSGGLWDQCFTEATGA